MKYGKTILRGVCLSFVVVNLVLAAPSEGRIDLDSVMGMWLLDENKDDIAYDGSENGHDGEFVNDVEFTEGKFGQGIIVAGDGYVDHGALPTLDVGLDNFSLVSWVKTSGEPPDWHAAIIHKAVWPAPRHGYLLCIRGKLDPGRIGLPLLWVGLGTDAGVHLFGTQPINDGKWHHMAGVVDRKTAMKLYVDGELDAELDIQKYIKENEDNSSKFYIGGEPGRAHAIDREIDEVAVFKTVLTDAEVKTIYQKGLEWALGITAVGLSGKLTAAWGAIKYDLD